jgi:hypothetical protein
MNGRQFDDIAFYLKDPRFQRLWAKYEEYPPMGPLRVFVLRTVDPKHRYSNGGEPAGVAARARRAS